MNFPDSTIIILKRAEITDADILYNWINDSEVRAQSLSNHIISYDEHINWFNKKITDKNCYLYIAFKDETSVGMIRFDVRNNGAVISYLVDPIQRGKGFGTLIIYNGIKQFIIDSKFKGTLSATVKQVNIASVKIFEKIGFKAEKKYEGLILFKMFVHD